MRFLLRQLIYRLKNVQKSNYTHGGNSGDDVFAPLLGTKKKWAAHYISKNERAYNYLVTICICKLFLFSTK